MLESYFKRDHTLDRLRAEPTGRYMDNFAETLHTKGYGVWAAQAYLRAAAHLGIWMKRKGFSVMKLDEQVIGEFARHLPENMVGPWGLEPQTSTCQKITTGSSYHLCFFAALRARL